MHNCDEQSEIVISKIESLLKTNRTPIVVGIDGRCVSGKTTLAHALADHFQCDIIRSDDFCLRKEQRSVSRLKEPGGNIDRERMVQEIFGPLGCSDDIFYRPMDCKTFKLKDQEHIHIKDVLIIEGAYCLHPVFEPFYDLKVFVDIEPIPQAIRLVHRYGPEMAEVFQCHWIPLEERYLEYYNIKQNCDIVL